MFISDISKNKYSRTFSGNAPDNDPIQEVVTYEADASSEPIIAGARTQLYEGSDSSMTAYALKTKKHSGKSRAALRIAANYAIAALICLVIGIVYELFSHGVFSVLMVGAFTVPLIFGALPNLVIGLAGLKEPGYAAENVYACGIVSLTTGFMLNGVLDIFGTTNSLLKYYFIAGAFFTLLGAVLYFVQRRPAIQE